ncbi:MAG: fibronectin type III domain-containing protein [bacterium]
MAAAATSSDAISAVNLELVTLTEERAIITWYTGYTGSDDGLGRMEPAPADGVVYWGTDPNRLSRSTGAQVRDSPYHYVELRDLEPGQTYYYEARSAGKKALPTMFSLIAGNAVGTSDFGLASGGPYSFVVPEPPPGRFLFSIALCNDFHMGETQAGLVGSLPQIKGIEQLPGLRPYPELMLESLVMDARKLRARYLLAAGDISAEAVPIDLGHAGRILKRFGRYRRDYFVTRGNHDRAHAGAQYGVCRVGQWRGTIASTTPSFPATNRRTSPASCRDCASSASIRTTSPAAAAMPAGSRPTSSPGFATSSPPTATSRRSSSATIR